MGQNRLEIPSSKKPFIYVGNHSKRATNDALSCQFCGYKKLNHGRWTLSKEFCFASWVSMIYIMCEDPIKPMQTHNILHICMGNNVV